MNKKEHKNFFFISMFEHVNSHISYKSRKNTQILPAIFELVELVRKLNDS